MRAIRFDGSEVRYATDVAAPTPGPGEALVKMKRAGLSAVDARAARSGGGARFIGTLGHELVGVVDDINLPSDAPSSLRARLALKGKRVVSSANILCGNCDMCRSGLSAHCRQRKVLGLSGRDGCLAEYVTVPLLCLHAVPDSVSDDRAALCDTVAGALHTAQLVHADSKSFITVLGDNLAAILTALALGTLNKSARLLATRSDRLALCDRWGLKHRSVEEAGRRQDQDVVIDCTGTSAGLRLAFQHVRPRGTIVVSTPGGAMPFAPGLPLPADPDPGWATPVDLSPVVANELLVLGSRDGSIPDALAFLQKHDVDAASVISKRFKLEQGVEALKAAGDPEQLKVVVEG